MAQQWANATHKGQITINAPAEKIFDVLANIENLPAYMPGISNAQHKNNELRATYSVQVLGLTSPISFPVEIRVSDSQKPTTISSQWSSLVKGTLQWHLQPNGNQTLVSATADYQMNVGQALEQVTATAATGAAGSLVGGLVGGVGKAVSNVADSVTKVLPSVVAVNEGNFHAMLTNLKVICENLRS